MKSPLNRGGLRFYLVAIALGAGTLLSNATTSHTILVGLPCLLLGVGLHTWAKGCLRQNQLVARIGPYRFVRHPFYLANALIDAGLVIMAGWIPLAIGLPLWWLAIYVPVIRGEERYLSEKFPDEYPPYRRRVPCLVPWRRPLPYAGDGFRWSNPNIAGGEELPRAVRILAYPLLFVVVQGLRNGRLEWLRDGRNLTGLIALLTLHFLAWQLHRHQRQRRSIFPQTMQHPIFRVIAGGAVLAAVCMISGPRTSFGHVVAISGVALLMLSVPVFMWRPGRPILAEMLALLGAIAAGELLWLALPVAAIYMAWILDLLLDKGASFDYATEPAAPPRCWPYFYPLLAMACAAVIGVKLVGVVLPVHMGGRHALQAIACACQIR